MIVRPLSKQCCLTVLGSMQNDDQFNIESYPDRGLGDWISNRIYNLVNQKWESISKQCTLSLF
jgi:hypothetical protein